ncbi:MAG: glucose-1-phosphate adenylyltransferase subunit GlgD [Clostridiales Family XIII bacterium]|jgi:glucose-1-phosphate adenylyltransferase|nr:glucose-1-phosphate adenylyltransferase subunit GlgD [Clostridiales Family XIII bacterium]
MIRDAFGLIFTGEQNVRLRELVELRAVGALPIGGRYRIIDFPISNMVNSEIRNVGVITNRNYHSLMDHLGSGKSWDLSRKNDGLFILTPYANRENLGIYRGWLDAMKGSMDYLRRAKQEYCILSASHSIFNMVFDDMMRYHIESEADITILYNKLSNENYSGVRYEDVRMRFGRDGRLKQLEINPEISSLNLLCMDTFIIRKDTLIYLVEESVAQGWHYFVDDLIRGNMNRLKIVGYEHKGYVGRMHSVESYFDVNMELLDANLQKELFQGSHRIYTKVKDEVPAKYTADATVSNCIVANGCIIEGDVANSVLFRGVYVGKGAVIRNSILLPNTEVNNNAELEYVITDKNVSLRNRSRLVGDRSFPVFIRKGATV